MNWSPMLTMAEERLGSAETASGRNRRIDQDYILCIDHGAMPNAGAKFNVLDGHALITYTIPDKAVAISNVCEWAAVQ